VWSAPVWAPLLQPPELSEDYLDDILTCLVKLDLRYLAKNPGTPRLYDAGIRYQAEPKGEERFASVPVVLALGFGDCEDLACWRVAELILRGEPASVRITRHIGVFHVTVRRGTGMVEDPSRLLGM
jgi:hypothetical protein